MRTLQRTMINGREFYEVETFNRARLCIVKRCFIDRKPVTRVKFNHEMAKAKETER